MRFWHRLRGHTRHVSRVTVQAFDPTARGLLITCSCGKVWAL